MLDVALAELNVGESAFARVLARLGDHFFGHVDADHEAAVAHLLGGEEAIDAAAGAEIDDHFT